DAGPPDANTPLQRMHRHDIEWLSPDALERVDLVPQTANKSTGQGNSVVVVDVEFATACVAVETNDIDPFGQPCLERICRRRILTRADDNSAAATLVKHLQPRIRRTSHCCRSDHRSLPVDLRSFRESQFP